MQSNVLNDLAETKRRWKEKKPLEPCLNMLMLPTAGRNSRLSRRHGKEDRPRVVPSGQKCVLQWLGTSLFITCNLCGNFIAC